MRGVAKPGAHRPAECFGRHGLRGLGPAPPDQDSDDGQERHRVEQEDPARSSEGDDETTDCRPDRPPDVERHRPEGDRLTKLGRGDEVGLDGLECGERESRSQTEAEGQGEEAGRCDDIGERHRRECRGAAQHPQLTADQQPPSIDDVSKGAARQSDQEDGQHAGGRNERDQEW